MTSYDSLDQALAEYISVSFMALAHEESSRRSLPPELTADPDPVVALLPLSPRLRNRLEAFDRRSDASPARRVLADQRALEALGDPAFTVRYGDRGLAMLRTYISSRMASSLETLRHGDAADQTLAKAVAVGTAGVEVTL